MHKRMAGIGAFLAVLLVWSAAGFAGEAAAPAMKPAARPAGVPAEAAVWMVAPAPKATMERLKKLVDSFQPGAGAMAEMVIKQGSPWNFEAADETKPIVAICQLPKKEGEQPQWAVVGSLKAGSDGAAALEKRFGGKPVKTEAGLSVFTQVQEGALPDKEIFAAAKDGRVTLGDSKELVKLLSACPAPAEGAYPAGADLIVGVDVKSLAAQYKDEIEKGLKEFETNISGAAQMFAQGEDNAKAVALVGKLLSDKSREGLRQTEQLGLRIGLGEALSLAVTVKALPETPLAAELAKLEKLGLPSAGLLQEGSMTATVASLPPEYLSSVAELIGPFTRAALASKGGDQKDKVEVEFGKFVDTCTTLAKQFDGKFAFSMGKSGREGGTGFMGVKDPAAFRAAMVGMQKLLQEGPLAELMQKNNGAKVTLKEKVRQSGGLDVDRITTEIVGGNPNMPPEMAEFQKKLSIALYGEMPVIQEFACTKDSVLMTVGKGSAAALDELIARRAGTKPGTAAMAGTIQAAPKGSFVAGEAYLLDCVGMLMKAMNEAGGMFAMMKLDLPKDAEKTPITAYLSASGGELGAELRLPVESIKKLADAFKKMQQDMMGNPPPVVPLPVE